MKLKVKKSYGISPYVVYCPLDFSYHTHCWKKEVAYIIKHNVEHLRLPKTKDIRLLKSHLRVTDNGEYKKAIENRIAFIVLSKRGKRNESR